MSAPLYDRAYFDALYAANPDPWDFRSSPYEQAKYAASIAAVADRRYSAGLEAGCSIGELSARLAPLCDRFLGIDIAERPLRAARARCVAIPSVRFECRALPGEWPSGRFDLIVLSEMLYFLTDTDIGRMASLVPAALVPGGRVLLVNWLGAKETPPPGDIAAERFIAQAGLAQETHARQPLYRLDLLTRDRDPAKNSPAWIDRQQRDRRHPDIMRAGG